VGLAQARHAEEDHAAVRRVEPALGRAVDHVRAPRRRPPTRPSRTRRPSARTAKPA
jgi:hypothetical protein